MEAEELQYCRLRRRAYAAVRLWQENVEEEINEIYYIEETGKRRQNHGTEHRILPPLFWRFTPGFSDLNTVSGQFCILQINQSNPK